MTITTSQTAKSMTAYLYTANTEMYKISNHRLCILKWKKSEKKDAFASRIIAIPNFTVQINPAILQNALTQALNNLQDQIIREYVEEQLNKDANIGIFSIPDDLVSSEAIARYTSNAEQSSRINKEVINAWFDSDLKEIFQETMLAKLMKKYPEDEDMQLSVLEQATIQHKEKLSSLSDPRYAHKPQLDEQLLKVVMLADNGSKVSNFIIKKLETLCATKQQDILDSI